MRSRSRCVFHLREGQINPGGHCIRSTKPVIDGKKSLSYSHRMRSSNGGGTDHDRRSAYGTVEARMRSGGLSLKLGCYPMDYPGPTYKNASTYAYMNKYSEKTHYLRDIMMFTEGLQLLIEIANAFFVRLGSQFRDAFLQLVNRTHSEWPAHAGIVGQRLPRVFDSMCVRAFFGSLQSVARRQFFCWS